MSSHDSYRMPSPYYWDERAGLTDDTPFYVKLLRTETQSEQMPSKCPSVFAMRVGYTMPFQQSSHQVIWQVIPSECELQHNCLVFVPMPKENELRKRTSHSKGSEQEKEETKAQPRPKPAYIPKEEAPSGNQPSYVVKYLPLPLSAVCRPPVPLGVTFRTKQGNHRVVWDVMPSHVSLAKGMLFLDKWHAPTHQEDDAPASSSWWQRFRP
ncbi:MAG: hypothetical protein AAF738_03700 [Bacteroidota bacterium]